MQTDNPWNPPAHKEKKRHKIECSCGLKAWAFQFRDVRSISGINAEFICDGCYTKLERELTDIDGTGKPKDTREFKQKFLKIQGAPAEIVDQIGKITK